MKLPNKLSLGARTDYLHAPKLGEQSIEVLREAGLSESAIEVLLNDKATYDGRIKAARYKDIN